MNIYGQDNLLKELLILTQKSTPFQLVGSQGVGKSTILEWISQNSNIPAILVSCSETRAEWLKEIKRCAGIEAKKTNDIQRALEAGEVQKFALFVDDLQQIKPQLIQLIKSLKNCFICYAGDTEREEAKRLLWGVKKIEIKKLDKKASEHLAFEAQKLSQNKNIDIQKIIQNSGGNPQMIIAQINGIETDALAKDRREEINILPLIIAIFVCIVISLRYLGRAVGETDLYLIGGMGIGVALIVRIFGRF